MTTTDPGLPAGGPTPPTPPFPPGWSTTTTTKKPIKKRWIFLGFLAFCFALGGIISAVTGGAKNNVATTDTGSPAASTPAASSGSTSGLLGWWSTNQGDFTAVTTDLTAIESDAKADNEAALASDCSTALTDIGTLQADPPIPVAAVNTPYQQGLVDMARAANECQTAINADDTNLMESAVSDFTSGNSLLDEAAGALKAATGTS